jgi:hypothetical protein
VGDGIATAQSFDFPQLALEPFRGFGLSFAPAT